jgi:stringent starvation protein B
LTIGNDVIQFSARFNGVSREVSVPVYAVLAAFARENGKGVYFDPEPAPSALEAVPIPALTPALSPVPKAAPVTSISSASASSTSGDQPTPPDKPKAPPRGNLRVIK